MLRRPHCARGPQKLIEERVCGHAYFTCAYVPFPIAGVSACLNSKGGTAAAVVCHVTGQRSSIRAAALLGFRALLSQTSGQELLCPGAWHTMCGTVRQGESTYTTQAWILHK